MARVTTAGRLMALGILDRSNALSFAANAAIIDALADSYEKAPPAGVLNYAHALGIEPSEIRREIIHALGVQPLHTGVGP